MKSIKLLLQSFALSASIIISTPAFSANPPAIDFETIMDSYFDDESGLIRFDDFRLAFAPEGKFNGLVAVLDAQGKIVGQHKFFEDYAHRDGVFAKIRAVGPADVKLTEPGLYTIVFVADSKPITRFLVRLEQTSAGDDAFNPEKTYRFDGYWRTMAHLTMKTYKDEPFPELTMWAGGKDLPEGKNKDMFSVALLRSGEMVAHSKRTTGFISTGHFEAKHIKFYHPHEKKKEVNAELFMLTDLQVEGEYEVSVTRQSDGQKIRSYDFDVVDGKIQSIARSKLGYEQATDLVLPRVHTRSQHYYDMTEAFWIEDIKR